MYGEDLLVLLKKEGEKRCCEGAVLPCCVSWNCIIESCSSQVASWKVKIEKHVRSIQNVATCKGGR